MKQSTFAREVRLAEFTARHLWQALRPLIGRGLARRCRRCILSEAYAPLDDDGICPDCRASGGATTAGDSAPSQDRVQALDGMLRDFEGSATGRHDAVLLFSGGKDSSYLLHRISTEFPKLRLLVVLVDNGFMSPYALANADRVLRRFDVDMQILRPRQSFVKNAFRYTLTNLDRQDGYSIVDLMDGNITFDSAKRLAVDHGIPLILCGLSRVQAEFAIGLEDFELPRAEQVGPPAEFAGIPLDEIFSTEDMDYWWDGSRWPEERVPRFLCPLCAWEPTEEHIVAEVARLDLLDPRRTSPLMTNNSLIPVIAMAEVARFGYCCWEVEFARMVREGLSERRYWLNLFEMVEYSAKTGRLISRSVDETLARLDLTRADVGIG